MMMKAEQALNLVKRMGVVRSKHLTQPGTFHRS